MTLERKRKEKMNDDAYSLFVMKRSFEMEKNERKTFFWLEIIETENDSRCFVPVSEDFFSLEEIVIKLQMMFPECVLENVCGREVYDTYETCMIVKRIKQNVLRDCAENCKNLM